MNLLYQASRLYLAYLISMYCIFIKYDTDLHGRRIKILALFCATGQVLSPNQYQRAILEIVKDESEGEGIATLSELPRTDWAHARRHLMKLSSRNRDSLEDVETAVICMSIGDRPVEVIF